MANQSITAFICTMTKKKFWFSLASQRMALTPDPSHSGQAFLVTMKNSAMVALSAIMRMVMFLVLHGKHSPVCQTANVNNLHERVLLRQRRLAAVHVFLAPYEGL
jgi:hypothetical protein